MYCFDAKISIMLMQVHQNVIGMFLDHTYVFNCPISTSWKLNIE